MSTTESTPSDSDEPTTPEQTAADADPDTNDIEQAFFDTETAAGGFEAALEASLLQDVLAALGAFVDEVRIHLSDEGLGIKAVDPADVGMIEIRMPKLVFEQYQTPGGRIGLNLDQFANVLRMANKGDLVSLTLDTETRKLKVETDGLEFELACIDPATIRGDPEITELEMDVDVTVAKAELSQVYKASNLIADHLEVAGAPEDDTVVFAAEGDSDDMQYTVDDDLDAIDGLSESSALYSLEYITDARKGMGRSCQVEMRFGQDHPIEFTYQLGDAIDVRTMIAPRIRH